MITLFSYDEEECASFRAAIPGIRRELSKVSFDSRDVISYGIDGSTFRAYRNLPIAPSEAYRFWAKDFCDTLDTKTLTLKVSTPKRFRAWHESLGDSIGEAWKQQQGIELSFAHTYKLVDLFVKYLSRYDFNSPQLTKSVEQNANCALDSKILTKINKCLSFALPLSDKPSMGHIHNRVTYDFCQQLIDGFVAHCGEGGTRLFFDYWAWGEGRESIVTSAT